jgi:hypothetical protein
VRDSVFILNGVKEDEYDQRELARYMTEVQEVLARVLKTSRAALKVFYVPRLEKALRTRFDSLPMLHAHCRMLHGLRSVTPKCLTPLEGGKTLQLQRDDLKDQLLTLKQTIRDQEAALAADIAARSAEWEQEFKKQAEAEAARQRALQEELQRQQEAAAAAAARARASGGGGGGCFSSSSSVIMIIDDAVTNRQRPLLMCDVKVGDVILGFDYRRQCLVPARVLLVDQHHTHRMIMLRISLCDGTVLELTPDHLLPAFSATSKQANVVRADEVRVGEHYLVLADKTGSMCCSRNGVVIGIVPVTAVPTNIYTDRDTVVVNGVACSCYAVSEWIGWVDMLPTKLLDFVWPGATGSAWFESFRKRFDSHIGDRILYGQ